MMASPAAIHPSAFLGPGVTLGADVVIGPNAVLLGPLRVGDRVWIGPGTQIGAPPEIGTSRQNAAWTGDLDHAGVVIEDDALIRELVVVHQGTHRPTTVGAGCLLFNRSYLAHDVQVGAGTTVSAGVSIGGHSTIRPGANLGMNVTVHQWRSIGDLAMVGMGTAVTHDVPPFAKAYGVPVRVHGANVFGMRRAGLSPEAIEAVEAALADVQGSEVLGAASRSEALADGPRSETLCAASRAGEPGAGVLGLPEVADAFAWWARVADRRPAPLHSHR